MNKKVKKLGIGLLIMILLVSMLGCSKKTDEDKQVENMLKYLEKEDKEQKKIDEAKKEEEIKKNLDDIDITIDNYKKHIEISEDRIMKYEDCFFEYKKISRNFIEITKGEKNNEAPKDLVLPSAIVEPDGKLMIIKMIGVDAFADLDIESVEFPELVEHIGNSAFLGHNIRGTLTIPESVSYIGNRTFLTELSYMSDFKRPNYGIRELIIPEGSQLSFIGIEAFKYNQLTEIRFPKLERLSLYQGAFDNNLIEDITFSKIEKLTIDLNVFANNKITSVEINTEREKTTLDKDAFINNGPNGDSFPTITYK